MTYASSVFGHRATLVKPRERLQHAQRSALVAITRAYRTTSREALCVLAGVLPLDYLVWERAAMYWLRRFEPPAYSAGNDLKPRERGQSMVSVRRRVRARIFEDWNA